MRHIYLVQLQAFICSCQTLLLISSETFQNCSLYYQPDIQIKTQIEDFMLATSPQLEKLLIQSKQDKMIVEEIGSEQDEINDFTIANSVFYVCDQIKGIINLCPDILGSQISSSFLYHFGSIMFEHQDQETVKYQYQVQKIIKQTINCWISKDQKAEQNFVNRQLIFEIIQDALIKAFKQEIDTDLNKTLKLAEFINQCIGTNYLENNESSQRFFEFLAEGINFGFEDIPNFKYFKVCSVFLKSLESLISKDLQNLYISFEQNKRQLIMHLEGKHQLNWQKFIDPINQFHKQLADLVGGSRHQTIPKKNNFKDHQDKVVLQRREEEKIKNLQNNKLQVQNQAEVNTNTSETTSINQDKQTLEQLQKLSTNSQNKDLQNTRQSISQSNNTHNSQNKGQQKNEKEDQVKYNNQNNFNNSKNAKAQIQENHEASCYIADSQQRSEKDISINKNQKLSEKDVSGIQYSVQSQSCKNMQESIDKILYSSEETNSHQKSQQANFVNAAKQQNSSQYDYSFGEVNLLNEERSIINQDKDSSVEFQIRESRQRRIRINRESQESFKEEERELPQAESCKAKKKRKISKIVNWE